MGVPLNAAESSAWDMDSSEGDSERASLVASTSRGVTAGSVSSCAKRPFQGQRDWETCRP